jgi:hypothetical protein
MPSLRVDPNSHLRRLPLFGGFNSLILSLTPQALDLPLPLQFGSRLVLWYDAKRLSTLTLDDTTLVAIADRSPNGDGGIGIQEPQFGSTGLQPFGITFMVT